MVTVREVAVLRVERRCEVFLRLAQSHRQNGDLAKARLVAGQAACEARRADRLDLVDAAHEALTAGRCR